MSYHCKTCGAAASEAGHLCNPVPLCGDCELCEEPMGDARHICKPALKKMEYVCEGCGRPAMRPELVCKPKKIR